MAGDRKNAGKRRAWRYRAYFVVLDITTAVTVISIVQVLLDPAALLRDYEPGLAHQVVGVLGFILPIFLMFARSWRDEFAELCWQRAAGTTLKLLFLAPVAVLFALGIKAGWDDAHQRALGANPPPPVSPLDTYTAGDALAWCWALLITLFILAFQFHRWRGSR